MNIVSRSDSESGDLNSIHVKDEHGREYLAEKVFISKTPRSRVIMDIIKELKSLIEKNKVIKHPAFGTYQGLERFEGEYYLLKKADYTKVTPLPIYIKKNKPSLEKKVKWIINIAEIAKEAEKGGLSWKGFTLESLWVDNRGNIKLSDPDIVSLIGKYRKIGAILPESDAFLPPEFFKQKKWDMGSRIYSFGAITYYLLTEKVPYESVSKSDLIDVIVHVDPVEPKYINYKISEHLNNMVMDLLNKDPNKRISVWEEVIDRLRYIKNNRLILSSKLGEKHNRDKGKKLVKYKKNKYIYKLFFRRNWKKILFILVILTGFIILPYFTNKESIITEDTPAIEVVKYFYQSIDEKDYLLLKDTITVEPGHLERLVSDAYVLEKMKSAYERNNGNSEEIFGIKNLKITLLKNRPLPVYKTRYIFFINKEEGILQTGMVDIIELDKIQGKWRIVRLDGGLTYIINGKIEELFNNKNMN